MKKMVVLKIVFVHLLVFGLSKKTIIKLSEN